jgi:uncharacterized membrane protein YhaH (DUF805 family)
MDWKYLLTSFEGRINRAKFWAAIGVFIVAGLVASVIDNLLLRISFGDSGVGPVYLIVMIASIYCALAVYAKRWHDRDKSGWWSLIMLVPIIGGVWLLVECGILEGTRGPNRFGADPLA